MSDALMATYKLVWDDYLCLVFRDAIKPEFVDGKAQSIDKITYDATINFFEKIF
jgi:valyl-tRNA synthetase